MIPRLGDGNGRVKVGETERYSLENDSPSRGRKPRRAWNNARAVACLENDSPSRGRKRNE